jgi:hypothetical protein
MEQLSPDILIVKEWVRTNRLAQESSRKSWSFEAGEFITPDVATSVTSIYIGLKFVHEWTRATTEGIIRFF